MFTIFADGECIYSDTYALDNRKLANPKLTLEDCAAGSLSITVPPVNVGYSKIQKLISTITVEKDGKEIWEGRPLTEQLDYLKDYPDTSSQLIQFGSNLLDFTRNWDLVEYATVLLPLGARLEESPIEALDAYLTIESVNEESMYLQSPEAVAMYGWIEKKVRFDDITDPAVLLEKAQEYLNDIQFDDLKLEVSALDLHYLHANVEEIKLLDEVRVISRPHGLDRMFPVTKLVIPLDSPEETKFTGRLGESEPD